MVSNSRSARVAKVYAERHAESHAKSHAEGYASWNANHSEPQNVDSAAKFARDARFFEAAKPCY